MKGFFKMTEKNRISDIIAITGGKDTIYYPKKLLARRDICDNAKFIFACTLTDYNTLTLEEFSNKLISIGEKSDSKRTKRDLCKLAGQVAMILE